MAICLVAGDDGSSYKQFNLASEEITGDSFWASGPNYSTLTDREIVYSTTTTDGDGVETTTYSNTKYFHIFDCSGSIDYDYTCYKFQPSFKNSKNNEFYPKYYPRFGPEDGAVAFYLFDGFADISSINANGVAKGKSTAGTL